jgi:hypothetical protein
MRLSAEPLGDDLTQQAFLFGPIVLAGQFPRDGIDDYLMHNQGPELQELPLLPVTSLMAHDSDPEDWIQTIPDQALHFHITGQAEELMLKPLNQSWDRFVVYWTVA